MAITQLNPFLKQDEDLVLPNKNLYYCSVSYYEEHGNNSQDDDDNDIDEYCFVLSDDIENAKVLVLRELKSNKSYYFEDTLNRLQLEDAGNSFRAKNITNKIVGEFTRIDNGSLGFIMKEPPINDIGCEITMVDYFDRLKTIRKKNEEFEKRDNKQLKFPFWEK